MPQPLDVSSVTDLAGGDARHRVALGTLDGRVLRAAPLRPVLVIGPQRSRKTSSVVVPAVAEWDGPVITTSIRRDVLDETWAARSRLGECAVYDPTGRAAVGRPTVGWDPVSECGSWGAAVRVADWIATSSQSAATGVNEAFWMAMARQALGPCLRAAAIGGRGIDSVLRWISGDSLSEPLRLLKRHGELTAHVMLKGFAEFEARTRANVLAVTRGTLDAWVDPDVLASAVTGGLDVEALLDGRGTLYLCAPPDEQRRLAPLFAALVTSVLREAYRREGEGRPLDPPLLVALDEAANVAPLPDLDVLTTTAAGTGVQLVTVWHSISQLRARYGREHADTIAANHSAVLVLPGQRDPQTLAEVGAWLGVEGPEHARHIRQLRPGTALLVYEHLDAVEVGLRSRFTDFEVAARLLSPAGAVGPDASLGSLI